jgi:hypothetical protein
MTRPRYRTSFANSLTDHLCVGLESRQIENGMFRVGHGEAVEVRGPGEIGPAFQLIGVGLVAVAEDGERVVAQRQTERRVRFVRDPDDYDRRLARIARLLAGVCLQEISHRSH